MTSRVFFCDVVISLLQYSCACGGVPNTILQSGGIYATTVQTDGISATPLQTAGVSSTPVQSSGVSALTHMISVIEISLQKLNFPSLVLKKMPNLPAPSPDLRPIQTTLLLNQTTLRPIQKSLTSSWFGSDKLFKLLRNKS